MGGTLDPDPDLVAPPPSPYMFQTFLTLGRCLGNGAYLSLFIILLASPIELTAWAREESESRSIGGYGQG